MELNRIIYVATYAGKILLESGGETYRVEDTIGRICNAYGIRKVESFVVPTAIITSAVSDEYKSKAVIKRIRNRSFNLQKIVRVNELSRKIQSEPITIRELYAELKAIDQANSYPLWLSSLFYSFISSGYVLFFAGSFLEMVNAFISASVMRLSMYIFEKDNYNVVFIHVLGGAVAAVSTLLLVYFGVGVQSNTILISVLMNLFPGLILANAIRDIMAGDTLSGVARTTEALLIAIAIAAGSGTVVALSMKWLGSGAV
ncbi:threonine/serine exporter family protein [Paenibacillus sp. UMB4589-SE434]|uniref:threonine/serine ThrE exporter family protein n=1 Tax=Paenibacillus sp. UMB4589-SE434 TaxID=3046314 RepID=UPI00255069F3|nr:threonine/serine exporter family protein [Paenibacillus sp. UMB4589-SE434]MDK8183150.1 threonine/serine exporter family protein [Paenibacillus sp. UMB4589-SE434]